MPSRRRDCHSTNLSKPALSLAPHHVLASLVKGEVLSPKRIRATTGGIAPYPHQPSKDLTIPRKSPSPLPFNERSVGFASVLPHSPCANTLASLVKGEALSPEKNSGDYRRDCHSTNLSKPALSLSLFVGEELAPPVAPILVVSTNLCKRTLIPCDMHPKS